MFRRLFAVLSAVHFLAVVQPSQAIPYSEYILAPSQRLLVPISVYSANGAISNAAGLTSSGTGVTSFQGVSAITYDYQINIAGLVSFVVSDVSGLGQYIGISYSESSLWISPDGSDATQDVAIDETLWFSVDGPGSYTVDTGHDRGGFRYLNIYHNSTGNISLSDVTTRYSAMPHYSDDAMRDYTGYFHSSDDQLNRVWYAAAYTCQLCTIPSTSGNSLVNPDATDPTIPSFWWSNSTLTNGTSALVDGAKRDKLIWPGDYSVSVPGVFLSTNDAITVKSSLEQLFATQNTTTGQLPYFAAPIVADPLVGIVAHVHEIWSFTYHLYTILGLNNYWVYSTDIVYLAENWYRVKIGLDYSLATIDEIGLANVTSSADWLRVGMGGHNIEANSLFAYTLDTAITLAQALNETSEVTRWANYSAGIKSAANRLLWDTKAGMYKDNETTALHPQDGNTWAIISGVANVTQATIISSNLASRWGPCGAPAPEAGVTISPFISSFELQAHFLAGQPQRAIDLMHFMWGDFMLDDPRMTNSTFNEGYSVDGALHYPAYKNDPRISHAHGWSTGPIIALTNYVAGLHVLNATNWIVHPQPGNLTSVEAGFETAAGKYSATYATDTSKTQYTFSTPEGTSGDLILDIPDRDVSVLVTDHDETFGKTRGGMIIWNERLRGFRGPRPVGCSYWGPQKSAEVEDSYGTFTISGLRGSNYTVEMRFDNT